MKRTFYTCKGIFYKKAMANKKRYKLSETIYFHKIGEKDAPK